ncbi:MAG: TIGR02281 family clan AA aspartic protease [Rhodothalassiaceae bacterium]
MSGHIPETGPRPSGPWQASPPPPPRPPRRRGKGLTFLGLWLVIVVVLAVGYSFRRELGAAGDRLAAHVTGSGYELGEGLAFERARDGHFYVNADVNGVPVRFLVDTGASAVVLTPKDAARIGLPPDALRFTASAMTANGRVAVAPVRLDSVAAGDVRADNVPALVNGGELKRSLLGMSFLNRIGGFEVRQQRLVLYPKGA